MLKPDDVAPVIQLYPRQPYGRQQMSRWFRRLAQYLEEDALDITPEAFVLVLINETSVRVYPAGKSTLVDEAAQAAKDARDHRRWPLMYEAPDVMRAGRRQMQREREAATPWVCEVCQSRMDTRQAYDRHQAPGHHCMTCHQVYVTVEAWEAHPCVATPSGPVQLRLVPPAHVEDEPA